MRYTPITSNFYKENRAKLRNSIDDNELIICFSAELKHRNGDQNCKYRQDSDFFYLSGIEQEKSILLISKTTEKLFVEKISQKDEVWFGKKLSNSQIEDISGLSNINNVENFTTDKCFENFTTYITNNKYLASLTIKKDLDVFKDLSDLTTPLRLTKSEEEIIQLKKAINITHRAFLDILEYIKPERYEYELEAIVTKRFISEGASDHAYQPIVASGINACILHYIENDKICNNGDLVLFDIGAEYGNYAADLSRTIPVNGKFSARQKEVFDSVLRVFYKARELYVIGNTINIINVEVAAIMEEELILLGLINKEQIEYNKKNNLEPAYKKYFMHGTAHFIGLDVHDVGNKDVVFKEGMVLSCEPGIYIEEEEIGIRIENDILIAKNSYIDLMEDIPFF